MCKERGNDIDVSKVKFTNNTMFTSVFLDTDIVKDFLEQILNIKIVSIKSIIKEAVKDNISNIRGVRFDILIDGEEDVCDIEIQVHNTHDIPYRARYYQSIIDSSLMVKGDKEFSKLRKSYIIFICLFNPFEFNGTNQCIYFCEETYKGDNSKTYPVNNDAYKIFINSKCDKKYLSDNVLKSFVELLNDGLISSTKSSLTDKIIKKMNELRSNEDWRRKYMNDLRYKNELEYEITIMKALEKAKRMIEKGLDDETILYVCSELTRHQISDIRYEVEHVSV